MTARTGLFALFIQIVLSFNPALFVFSDAGYLLHPPIIATEGDVVYLYAQSDACDECSYAFTAGGITSNWTEAGSSGSYLWLLASVSVYSATAVARNGTVLSDPSNTVSVRVVARPQGYLSFQPRVTSVGGPVTLSGTWTRGGAGPFKFRWYRGSTSVPVAYVASTNSTAFQTFTPLASALTGGATTVVTVVLVIENGDGGLSHLITNGTLLVHPAPWVSVSAPNALTAGSNLTLAVGFGGGMPPLSLLYTVKKDGALVDGMSGTVVAAMDSPLSLSIPLTPDLVDETPRVLTVEVTVIDGASVTDMNSTAVLIHPSPRMACHADVNETTVGGNVTLHTVVLGGYPPTVDSVSVSLDASPPAALAATAAALYEVVPEEAGTLTFQARAQDQSGVTSNTCTATVHVNSPPSGVVLLSPSTSPVLLDAANASNVSACLSSLSGGTGAIVLRSWLLYRAGARAGLANATSALCARAALGPAHVGSALQLAAIVSDTAGVLVHVLSAVFRVSFPPTTTTATATSSTVESDTTTHTATDTQSNTAASTATGAHTFSTASNTFTTLSSGSTASSSAGTSATSTISGGTTTISGGTTTISGGTTTISGGTTTISGGTTTISGGTTTISGGTTTTTTTSTNSSTAATTVSEGTTASTVSEGTTASTVSEGTTATTVSEGTTATTVSEGTTASTVSEGTTASTVSEGTTATTVSEGTTATTVSEGTTASTVSGGTTATTVSEGTTASAVSGGTTATTVSEGTASSTVSGDTSTVSEGTTASTVSEGTTASTVSGDTSTVSEGTTASTVSEGTASSTVSGDTSTVSGTAGGTTASVSRGTTASTVSGDTVATRTSVSTTSGTATSTATAGTSTGATTVSTTRTAGGETVPTTTSAPSTMTTGSTTGTAASSTSGTTAAVVTATTEDALGGAGMYQVAPQQDDETVFPWWWIVAGIVVLLCCVAAVLLLLLRSRDDEPTGAYVPQAEVPVDFEDDMDFGDFEKAIDLESSWSGSSGGEASIVPLGQTRSYRQSMVRINNTEGMGNTLALPASHTIDLESAHVYGTLRGQGSATHLPYGDEDFLPIENEI